MIEVSGVRSSWEISATKRSRAASASTRSVTSWKITTVPSKVPSFSCIGVAETE